MSLKHILLAILPALSGIAAPQKAALPYEPQLKAFHDCAGEMSRVLYAANTALEAAADRQSADAAAPLVLAVHAENQRMTTVGRELEQAGAGVTELYGKGKLRQALRHRALQAEIVGYRNISSYYRTQALRRSQQNATAPSSPSPQN